MTRIISTRLALVVPLLFVACSTAAQPAAKQQTGTDVVATVGSVSVTLNEVDEKALQQQAGSFGNLKLSMAIYEARRSAIEEIVGEKLLAQESKTRGITSAALMDQEIRVLVIAAESWDSHSGDRVITVSSPLSLVRFRVMLRHSAARVISVKVTGSFV